MPLLPNAKHELFCHALANGKTADESYILAGFKPNRGNATTLKHKQSILNRVSEILTEREAIHAQATADAVKSVGLTKEWVIERLVQNVERAMQAQSVKDAEGRPVGEYKYDGGVANKALELLGKEVGMFIDRKEIRTGLLDELPAEARSSLREQLAAELDRRAIAGVGPEGSGKPH